MNLLYPLFPDHAGSSPFSMRDADGDVAFETLCRRCETVAARLVEAGLEAGDPIVFHAGQRQEALVLFWAAMAVGAVFAPLDPGWPDYIVERALRPVNPRLIVCAAERCAFYHQLFPTALVIALTPDVADGDGEVAVDAPGWAEWSAGASSRSAGIADIPPTAPAAYLFTSGTTGAPKAVMLSRGALATGARLTLATFEWQAGERLINLPEPHTMSGLRNGLVAAPLGGLHWIPFGAAQRPDIFSLLDGFAEARPERLVLGPALLRQLAMLGHRVDPVCLASAKAIYCTGAMLSPVAVDQFHAQFKLPVINYYGLTETGGICISQRLGDWRANDRSLGAAAGAELRIRMQDGAFADTGTGELQVRSKQLMTGYLEDPDATAARFEDGWLRTGDLARIDAEGRIYLVGRESGFIKTATTDRVAPEEIETVLEEHPSVADAGVLGLAMEAGGERIAALVVLRDGVSRDDAEMELAHFVGERLGAARTPSLIRFVDAIPRRDTGKIIRPELQELLRERL